MRAGVGIHYVEWGRRPYNNIWQPLEGRIQAVPRVGLTVVLIVVMSMQLGGLIEFCAASEISKDAYYRGEVLATNHVVLWIKLFVMLKDKGNQLNLWQRPINTVFVSVNSTSGKKYIYIFIRI